MVTGTYSSSGAKDREFVIEEGDDTNLMLGLRKSIFTVMRSSFLEYNNETGKNDTVYEYWVKCPKTYLWEWTNKSRYIVANGHLCEGAGGVVANSYFERNSSFPKKIVFDSYRTALFPLLSAYNYYGGSAESDKIYQNACNFVGNWCYAGSSKDHPTGNFDLYGCIVHFPGDAFFYDWSYTYGNLFHFAYFSTDPISSSSYDAIRNYFSMGSGVPVVDFSGKIAEIRDWEIVSNTTPEQNTYYVVIEDSKGDILDVKTTTTFGLTVGSLIGEYADKFSDKVKNQRVIDDLVIRVGRRI